MSKTAIITDIHFGVRSDSEVFHDNREKFYMNVFWPELEKRGIKNILNLGDVFDNRKSINVMTARRAREYFFDPMKSLGIHMDIIAGNHDLYYRHESDTTALKEFLDGKYDVTIHTEVTQKGIYLYVPWIHDNNREESLSRIHKSNARIVFGHLELKNFKFDKIKVSQHGDDPAIFEKFESVRSGHFHHKHKIGNIEYIGSAHQDTWADVGDERGFYIMDDTTGDMEFIENPYTMFKQIKFGDKLTAEDIEGQYVRVYHEEISSKTKFDDYVKNIVESGAANVQTIPLVTETTNEGERGSESVALDDGPTLMRGLVEDDAVYNRMIDYYNMALAKGN